MSISRLDGHMYAIRRTKSVPGAFLIGGESRSASQCLSTRTKFGDQQYMFDDQQWSVTPLVFVAIEDSCPTVDGRQQLT